MATQHVMSGEAVDGGGADGAYVGDAADTDVDTVETHAIKRQRLLVTAEGQPSTARCCSTERREEGVASAAAPRGDAADAESTTIAPSLYWAGAQRRLWRSGSARENLDGPFPERPGPAQQSRDSQWLPSFNETNLQRALRIGGGGNSGRAGDDGEDGRTGERLASMRGQGTPHAHPHYNSDGSMPRDPPPDARGGSGGGGSTRRDGDGEGDGDVEMGVGLGTADDSGTVQGTSANNTDAAATTPTTTSTRLDLQLAMRWLEQALPFSLLLMLVFLQQHWLGLMTFASSTLLLCRVNDVVKRQVALREGRRAATLALTALSLLLFLCVMLPLPVPAGALWRQLLLLPPPRVPTFWEALWRVVMTDSLARNLSMLAKIAVLLTARQTAGPGFRRQAASLTLVEYISLLYRVLLPTPVWARFFLDKAAYGHFFSSLTTGLYLTFKVTAAVERACSLLLALQAFAKCDAHCGKAATPEEVARAGNLCAICHESMKTPVMLPCAHVFCDDCVAEWFDHTGEAQERTCPLCRAVVKSQGLKSTYGDGTSGLMLQMF